MILCKHERRRAKGKISCKPPFQSITPPERVSMTTKCFQILLYSFNFDFMILPKVGDSLGLLSESRPSIEQMLQTRYRLRARVYWITVRSSKSSTGSGIIYERSYPVVRLGWSVITSATLSKCRVQDARCLVHPFVLPRRNSPNMWGAYIRYWPRFGGLSNDRHVITGSMTKLIVE